MKGAKRETLIALKATHTAYRVANDIANPSTQEFEDALQQVEEKRQEIQDAARQSRERAGGGPYVSEAVKLDGQLEATWRAGVMGKPARFSTREKVFLVVFAWVAFACVVWVLMGLAMAPPG